MVFLDVLTDFCGGGSKVAFLGLWLSGVRGSAEGLGDCSTKLCFAEIPEMPF